MNAPVHLQDIHAGREAFQRDLAAYLKGRSLADVGWVEPDDLTLLVPVFVRNPETQQPDFYLLRLVFDHYPKGPPSAQFVNPLTLSYEYPKDVMWVPRSEGSQTIAFHPNYNGNVQLICSSTTLEFYKVNHSVEPANVWNCDRMNFISTLSAIRAGLTDGFYKGRAKAPA